MSYDALGVAALNYTPCKYENSRITFRGPERRLDVPYVAFLGGTETYGKFIKAPFPALVESDIGVNCVNFGVVNAGLDVFLNDPFALEAASAAKLTVLQIVGAQNLSNRFYSVHPRRNDRFLSASPLLCSIYPEVDFAEFHFNKHMLSALHEVSEERFEIVREELQIAWSARMKLMLRRIEGDVILLWFADHAPSGAHDFEANPACAKEPLYVTKAMIDDLSAHITDFVEVTASRDAIKSGTTGMIFSEMEGLAASKLMGPKAHGEAALQLGPVLHGKI